LEIKIAKHAGFCIGVRKAVEKALAATNSYEIKKPIYSLGHLVHNSFVVEELKKKGIIIVNSIDEINTTGTLIISAHGVSPHIFNQVKEKKLDVIDTTCTQVAKVQNLAKQLSNDGYLIIIIGDKNHPEVKGVREWAGTNSYVISNREEILPEILTKKIGIISQTTISLELFDTISKSIREKATAEVKIFNTICSATSTRQKAAITLAHEVDAMLIIGDNKSANTNRLYELSKGIQENSYLVAEPSIINKEWLLNKKNVGITAGASTPIEIIDSVIKKLRDMEQPNDQYT